VAWQIQFLMQLRPTTRAARAGLIALASRSARNDAADSFDDWRVLIGDDFDAPILKYPISRNQ
jgi:hypothetical protein